MSVSDLPSKSRAFVKAMRELGRAEAGPGVLPDPAAKTLSEAPMAAMDEWLENFCARWAFSRANDGV
jgi:hypothetical protein